MIQAVFKGTSYASFLGVPNLWPLKFCPTIAYHCVDDLTGWSSSDLAPLSVHLWPGTLFSTSSRDFVLVLVCCLSDQRLRFQNATWKAQNCKIFPSGFLNELVRHISGRSVLFFLPDDHQPNHQKIQLNDCWSPKHCGLYLYFKSSYSLLTIAQQNTRVFRRSSNQLTRTAWRCWPVAGGLESAICALI